MHIVRLTGLGRLCVAELASFQRRIKTELELAINRGALSLRFSDLCVCIAGAGGKLSAPRKRSLHRALQGLVDRKDIVIVAGVGRVDDPYQYAPNDPLAGLYKIFGEL
jgi:hypothetical protein